MSVLLVVTPAGWVSGWTYLPGDKAFEPTLSPMPWEELLSIFGPHPDAKVFVRIENEATEWPWPIRSRK